MVLLCTIWHKESFHWHLNKKLSWGNSSRLTINVQLILKVKEIFLMRAKHIISDFEGATNFLTPKFSWKPQLCVLPAYKNLRISGAWYVPGRPYALNCKVFFFVFIVFWQFWQCLEHDLCKKCIKHIERIPRKLESQSVFKYFLKLLWYNWLASSLVECPVLNQRLFWRGFNGHMHYIHTWALSVKRWNNYI